MLLYHTNNQLMIVQGMLKFAQPEISRFKPKNLYFMILNIYRPTPTALELESVFKKL